MALGDGLKGHESGERNRTLMAESPSSKVTKKNRSVAYDGSDARLSIKCSMPALAASISRTPDVARWFIEALVSTQKRKIILVVDFGSNRWCGAPFRAPSHGKIYGKFRSMDIDNHQIQT